MTTTNFILYDQLLILRICNCKTRTETRGQPVDICTELEANQYICTEGQYICTEGRSTTNQNRLNHAG